MPHSAIHLTLARRSMERWRTRHLAPFDIDDNRAVNAFLLGSLAPDMGHFPGGDDAVAHTVHTTRTGDVVRALLDTARSEPERAFAWGWLTHVIADVLIHPLVNEDAGRRVRDGIPPVVEHVRVESGLDVWFCSRDPDLPRLRLRPAFGTAGYRFLADTLDAVLGLRIATRRVARFERNVVMFTHGAIHFVTSMARHLWWKDRDAPRAPVLSALVWHTASRISPLTSMTRAYLTPHVPEPRLVQRVEDAFVRFEWMLDENVANRAVGLPDYNLENGELVGDSVGLRVA